MKKFLLFTVVLCAVAPLWGGISPKPEMNFTLVYQTDQHPAVLPDTSEQLQCTDNQCHQSTPLGEYGLQKLYCRPDGCFSIAYEYEPFQRLVLAFADGVTRTSNVFRAPAGLRANYHVIVRPQDLLVEPAPASPRVNELLRADAWTSLLIILLLEILAAWAYLAYTGTSYRVIYSVVAANLLSMPLSWQVLVRLVPEPWFIWLFCLVFETLFIWAFNRKRLTLRNAATLCVATNVTSYSLGMILSFLLAPYLF